MTAARPTLTEQMAMIAAAEAARGATISKGGFWSKGSGPWLSELFRFVDREGGGHPTEAYYGVLASLVKDLPPWAQRIPDTELGLRVFVATVAATREIRDEQQAAFEAVRGVLVEEARLARRRRALAERRQRRADRRAHRPERVKAHLALRERNLKQDAEERAKAAEAAARAEEREVKAAQPKPEKKGQRNERARA